MFIPTYTFIIFFKVFLPTCLFPPTLIFGTLEYTELAKGEYVFYCPEDQQYKIVHITVFKMHDEGEFMFW